MERRLLGSLAAVFLGGATGLGAQTPGATSRPAMTITGCVQKETTVLKRNPLVTDVGMNDEIVLTHARLELGPSVTDEPRAEPPIDEPIGTAGSASNLGRVYRITGDRESELKPYVGQRVEVAGSFK